MATVTRTLTSDQWVQIPATWDAYLQLEESRDEASNPRLIYREGRLTIVTKGYPHERYKVLMSWMIETMLATLSIEFGAIGETTLKLGRAGAKGLEADAAYYLTHLDQLPGKRQFVMGVDPAPDLALEIVISHPVEDALAIYAAFGVQEIWVCREDGVTFFVLDAHGTYEPASWSSWLPFLSSEEMTGWMLHDERLGGARIRRLFMDWLNNTLLPRYQDRQADHP